VPCVPVGASSLWSQCRCWFTPGTGITWVGIVTWVLQSLGVVVEGEEEEERKKDQGS
jgi:hypothetical protein